MPNGRDEVNATGPGGFGISLKAQNALIIIVMAVALGWTLYTQHVARVANVKTFDETVAHFEEIMKIVRLEHAQILERCGPSRHNAR